jgi:hypothetical protein
MFISKKILFVFFVFLIIAHFFAIFFDWYSSLIFDLILQFLGGFWSALLFVFLFRHIILLYPHKHFSEKLKMAIVITSFSSLSGIFWKMHELILNKYYPGYLRENLEVVMIELLAVIVGGFVSGYLSIKSLSKESSFSNT